PQLKPRNQEEAHQAVQPRPGFRVELVASEPLVRDPIAMAFDENSNLFVVEFPEYNHAHDGWKITRKGTVKRLVDQDGDGVFDRATVYVDQLNSPTAVACYNGGVLVGAAPDLLFCKDTDGDGVADVRQKLYTGFGITERGGGARLNSIRWNLDHQFHLCTSFSGGQVQSVVHPGMKAVEVQNRGFQFDPRSHRMAATSGAGQHGLAFDGWGNMFTCRNSNPFKQVMYESRYVARNPYLVADAAEVDITAEGKHTKLLRRSPLEPWRILRTRLRVDGKYRGSAEGGTAGGFFTSATGIVVYQGDAWPEQYRGNLFVGEVSNNLVQRVRLEGEGLQKVARRASDKAEFLASSDNWFRPIELINGPDGNLYLADMHREVIETTLAMPPEIVKHLTPGHGVKLGRIYRVVRTDRPSRKRPRLGELGTTELVKLLDHPNGWHRDTAARLLHEQRDPAAVPYLQVLAREAKLAEGRLLALYALRDRQV
ncbi:MAG: cytochrome C, partial [Planctomycetaceae bacterium]|nr:cytochrome C [Planctomycetaceae bacterium]